MIYIDENGLNSLKVDMSMLKLSFSYANGEFSAKLA